jgi:hypothetical protein
MASLILMGESLCRADARASLSLSVPDAPPSVRAWAARRPEVTLSSVRPEGVSGWNAKPWLLLRELDAGRREVLWLDDDIIVTGPVSPLLRDLDEETLALAEEWTNATAPACHYWNLKQARSMPAANNCFIRVTPAHRPLLVRWLDLLRDPRYLEAQALPFDRRPLAAAHDGWLLLALLESEEFGRVPVARIRRGRDIAQCAGSSGYSPHDRLLDLYRGLPTLIHGLGRKPWEATREPSRVRGFLLDWATDVSPYVLAAARVAKDINLEEAWISPRTWAGKLSRALARSHPGMTGLPLALLHGVFGKSP